MATDDWTITTETKVDGYGSTISLRHGRDKLLITLGRDGSEVRYNVERIRKALAAVIEDAGGE